MRTLTWGEHAIRKGLGQAEFDFAGWGTGTQRMTVAQIEETNRNNALAAHYQVLRRYHADQDARKRQAGASQC